MRFFISALLCALSYAQTDGFCVEWSECQSTYCDQPEKDYCPCTCTPGTINSGADHFLDTFGDSSSSSSSSSSSASDTSSTSSGSSDVTVDNSGSNTGTDVSNEVDFAGMGGSGDSSQPQATAPQAPVTFTVMRTGYICEEQDFELMHFRMGMVPVQQCAEQVARTPMCSPVFFAGSMSGNCGCVKRGFECAENESNDRQMDVNIYMLSRGTGMGPSASSGSGLPFASTGGLPIPNGAGPRPRVGPRPSAGFGGFDPAIMMNPKFEMPEEIFEGGMFGGYGAGPSWHTLSKSAKEAQSNQKPKSSGPSTFTLALCAIIPSLIGFAAGIGFLQCRKSSETTQSYDRMTV